MGIINKDKTMMTKDEYAKAVAEDESWAPGWDAIDESFEALYGKQEPSHYGTIITSRAIFGGPEYLDGYSIYQSGKGYYHIVTYGMSNLYGDIESYGQEYNGYGYEMTIKLKADDIEDCMWAINMMGNLARYNFTSGIAFRDNEYILGDGSPIKVDSDTKISSLLTIYDTELTGKDTVHGRLDYIQLVGITYDDALKVHEGGKRADVEKLLKIIKEDNPDYIIDLKSEKSYL